MLKRIKIAGFTVLALVVAVSVVVAWQSARTESDIAALEARVAAIAARQPSPGFDAQRLQGLPEPVQRYFRFTFKGPAPAYRAVRLTAAGDFRRPRTQDFNATTARQVIAAGVPALMFSATTPVMPGVWARAYDFYADGQMEMKAKIVSTLTVVDERGSAQLNQISLRRWLLESALYPAALLPGGPVSWEAIDERSARAVVNWQGLRATMVAHFAPDGSMTAMSAEADGDLSTPYHGSGEHVARADYRLIGYQMIPMEFTISRRAGGKLHPFWKGSVEDIAYE
jgi:hypothetical protein